MGRSQAGRQAKDGEQCIAWPGLVGFDGSRIDRRLVQLRHPPTPFPRTSIMTSNIEAVATRDHRAVISVERRPGEPMGGPSADLSDVVRSKEEDAIGAACHDDPTPPEDGDGWKIIAGVFRPRED
jgi:hypothetical protein